MSRLATKIPADLADYIARNAGVILNSFDPENWSVSEGNIKGATTGGISFNDVPAYSDFGADIDNCPKNTMELKEVDDHEVRCSGTFVSVKPDEIKHLIGAGSISSDVITPSHDLKESDFEDLWFVTDYGNGGAIALKLEHCLNVDGFSLKTTDKAKGQFAFNFMAHYSIKSPETVPYKVYIKEGDAA